MSLRGGGRGFATGANRGGNFGSRGGKYCDDVKLWSGFDITDEIFLRTGRGGFQQSFGPPAQVLGNSELLQREYGYGWLILLRNGFFHARLRR